MALVIGNSAYEHVAPLKNPLNDAQDIGATLENLGFSVTPGPGCQPGRNPAGGGPLSGGIFPEGELKWLCSITPATGVEYEGSNYIIPVNAEIRNEYELVDQAFSADRIVKAMDRNRAAFNLMVLDACRDNPFFSSRSGSRGLASMSGGGRSMIVFATSPGQVAADGSGRNSPFTKAFIEHAATPGLEVTDMMKAINGAVQKLTGGRQVPWYTTSYSEDVFLSAAEELTGADGLVGRVNREIAALEAAIAQREKAIASARTAGGKTASGTGTTAGTGRGKCQKDAGRTAGGNRRFAPKISCSRRNRKMPSVRQWKNSSPPRKPRSPSRQRHGVESFRS